MKKVEAAEEAFVARHEISPEKAAVFLMIKVALRRISKASKEWGAVVARFDDLSKSDYDEASTQLPPIDALMRTDLSYWIPPNTNTDDMDGSDPEENMWRRIERLGLPRRGRHVSREIVPNAVELYLCTFCLNPSATMKKCSGCGKAR